VADRSVSVPMTLSDLERRDVGVIFQANLNNARTVWPRTIRQDKTGEGRSSKGSATSLPQGSWPQRSPICGFPSIYACTPCRRTTKFGEVTRWRGACILGSATPSTPRHWSAPQFWGSSCIFAYTTFKANSAWWHTWV